MEQLAKRRSGVQRREVQWRGGTAAQQATAAWKDIGVGYSGLVGYIGVWGKAAWGVKQPGGVRGISAQPRCGNGSTSVSGSIWLTLGGERQESSVAGEENTDCIVSMPKVRIVSVGNTKYTACSAHMLLTPGTYAVRMLPTPGIYAVRMLSTH